MDITKKPDRTALKSYFVKNAVPTASNFADMIEGAINQKDDGIAKLAGEPLSIQADGDAASQKKTINFYRNFADPKPAWTLSLNPRADPNNPATAKPGWSIGDADGNSKLFIDQSTGNVGIGNVTPVSKLEVNGNLKVVFMSNTARDPDSKLGIGGNLVLKGNAPQIDFIDIDHNDWAIHVNSNKMYFAREPWNAMDLVLDGGGNIGIGTDVPRAKLEVRGGAIMPASGNAPTTGIQFPPDPGGGGSDAAWIRYYARSGEACTLELGTSNDEDDHIALMPSGNVGIGTLSPAERLAVEGRVKSGPLTVGPWPANGNYAFFGVNTLNQAEPGNYALLQGTSDGPGTTYLNSPVGIHFRIGNADKMILDNGGQLTVTGGAIFAGNSDIYFTKTDHDHTGTGNTAGFAAIENARNFNALMILGRAGTPNGRKVELWDYLKVNGTFVNNSDAREKRDVADLDYGLKEILQLHPVSFNWKKLPNPHKSMGLIAQEVKLVVGEAVYQDAEERDAPLSIAYVNLIPVLINAVKEIAAKVEQLAGGVAAKAH